MEASLRGRVALVAGGGSGAGPAAAAAFARRGAAVVVADLDGDAAERVAEALRAEGAAAPLAHRCDLGDEGAVEALFARIDAEHGRLDHLLHLAGPYRPEDPLAHWEAMVRSNLLAAIHTNRRAIERMRVSGGGAIVNVGSDSGLGFGPEAQPAYGAAKAGVMRLSAALGFLHERFGIRVNCLVPDWIGTEAVARAVGGLSGAERARRHVPAHLTTTEEFAEACLDLALREDLAGRVVLYWSGRPLELVDADDPGYARVHPYRDGER